jgi:hypothetical protein
MRELRAVFVVLLGVAACGGPRVPVEAADVRELPSSARFPTSGCPGTAYVIGAWRAKVIA